jgi:hypothetical protein
VKGRPTDYTAALAKMARRPPKGKPLTYRGGEGGLGNPATIFVGCPYCGFAVMVAQHGRGITARCTGGCDEPDVLGPLNVPRIAAELAARR